MRGKGMEGRKERGLTAGMRGRGRGRNVEERAREDVRENKGSWRRGKMRESWEGESGGEGEM
jgi:hypothetical protein